MYTKQQLQEIMETFHDIEFYQNDTLLGSIEVDTITWNSVSYVDYIELDPNDKLSPCDEFTETYDCTVLNEMCSLIAKFWEGHK